MVEVKKKDFEEIIDTANELVEKVESALSEEEIAVKERLKDVKKGIKGKTGKDVDSYLEGRGVKID